MDAILNSTRQSSLARVLTSEKTEIDYSVKIHPAKPKCATEIVTLALNNGSKIDSTGAPYKVALSKLGNVKALWLRFTIASMVNGNNHRASAASKTDDSYDRLFASELPALSLVESVAISTHSRVIQSLTAHGILAMIEQSPPGQREMWKALMGAGMKGALNNSTGTLLGDPYGLVTGTTHAESFSGGDPVSSDQVLYLPLLLSCLDGPGIWAGFLETLDLEVVFNKTSMAFNTGFTKADNAGKLSVGPTSIKVDLQCLYKTYADDVYTKAVNSVFRTTPSVQSLEQKWTLVGSGTADAGELANITQIFQPVEFTIHTSASDLSKALYVFVYPESHTLTNRNGDIVGEADTLLGPANCQRVVSVRFDASGRTIFDSSPESELMSYTPEGVFMSSASKAQSFFVHRFASSDKSNQYSNGCSLAGLSSQSFNVKALVRRRTPYGGVEASKSYATKYRCAIYSSSYLVTSIQSSSGSWRTSLSV